MTKITARPGLRALSMISALGVVLGALPAMGQEAIMLERIGAVRWARPEAAAPASPTTKPLAEATGPILLERIGAVRFVPPPQNAAAPSDGATAGSTSLWLVSDGQPVR